MRTTILLVLATLTAVLAKQDVKSSTALKDQDTAHDKVTSILIHPGPSGPRHVILSEGHEVISNSQEVLSSRAVNSYYFPSQVDGAEYHHTVPPPTRQVTYGPARAVRPQLLHRLAHGYSSTKEPRLKGVKEDKGFSDSTYKYSSYVKHGKNKDYGLKRNKFHINREFERPDLTFLDSYARRPYSDYGDEEERLYKESIGALDYSSEYKSRPQKHNYKKNVYSPVKSYKHQYSSYEEGDAYKGNPSGFDDHNGGQVVPLVARFYKQPLPIIQTHLPADNSGLYIQYVYPQAATYDTEGGNNYYPQERSDTTRNVYTYQSDWTPISGVTTVPLYKSSSSADAHHRDTDSASVVVGKNKQTMGSNQHIQGNSEGVVSAVVRVKQ